MVSLVIRLHLRGMNLSLSWPCSRQRSESTRADSDNELWRSQLENVTYDEASSEKKFSSPFSERGRLPDYRRSPRGCVPRTLSQLDVSANSMSDTGLLLPIDW
jgi:hypothetical protein